MEMQPVFQRIEASKQEMIDFMTKLIAIPAISPKSDGEGECHKADFLENWLKENGFPAPQRFEAPDPECPCGSRPSLLCTIPGKKKDKKIWVMTHIDVVPPGDLSKWDTDPYEAVVKDGKIFGRGVEDNGQELVASLFAIKTLMEMGIEPEYDVCLLLVADEETGSEFGAGYLADKLDFGKDDIIVVPDGGNEDGTLLEVAEKSIAWVKVETTGKQCHASTPDLGNNAFRAAMEFGCRVDKALHEKFDLTNELYDRPASTFEPTKKEANVPNVNTVPGDDIFYFDCRVLPQYKIADVLGEMRRVADEVEKEYGVGIALSTEQEEEAAPPTPADAEVVERLKNAVHTVYNNNPKAGGIGGGTVAAILRRQGLNAVVWAKMDETMHGPNEYVILDNLVNDCKIFALFYLEQ